LPPQPDTLVTLLTEVRSCRLCEASLPLGPRPVLQVQREARILIVGQAPGRRVHDSGIPFDDPSGERLREWLGVAPGVFYDPSRVALLPMGFCYPGSGRGGDLPPRPECAAAWRERLLAQLPRVELTLILGRYAIDWHLPELKRLSLASAVARWREFAPEIFIAPHPSPRNRLWLRRNAWFEREAVPALQARVRHCLRG
jgi:uracil-DNA glycosylase